MLRLVCARSLIDHPRGDKPPGGLDRLPSRRKDRIVALQRLRRSLTQTVIYAGLREVIFERGLCITRYKFERDDPSDTR